MVYVDFLSTTEVNLGIFFVSLPMLGPIYKRLTRRGKGSKLSATPDPNNAYERSSKSARSKKGLDDTICLETIYANNLEDSHNVTVMAHQDLETESQDGSEVSITKSVGSPTKILHEEDHLGRSIKVQTQWTVRHT